jgi:hypothetical protein
MSSNSKQFINTPSVLLDFCEAHQKTKPFKTSIDAYVTANLGILAGMLGNTVKVELRSGFSVYPNSYSYIIGNSGQGKSGYLSSGYEIISNIQSLKNKNYKQAKKERLASRKKIAEENKQRKQDGLSLLPNIQNKNLPEGVFNTKYPLCTMDFTIEGIQQDMSEKTGGNCFIIRDELIGTFKTFKKQGRQNDISFLNDAYECMGKTYEITRKMEAAKLDTIYNMCSNILGTIQTSGLRNQFKDYLKEGIADGFYARFQNISILPLEEEEQEYQPLDKNKTLRYEMLLEDITEERVRCSKIDPCDFVPHIIRFEEDAEKKYSDFAKDLRKVNKEQKNILFQEHLCKTATFLLKTCLGFHILQKPIGTVLSAYTKLIDLDTVTKAIWYVNKKIEYAKILYGVDEEVTFDMKKQADDLYNYLQGTDNNFYKKHVNTGWTLYVLKRTFSKILPRKNNNCIDEEMLESLLDYLEDQNKILSFSFQNPSNKKNITIYSLPAEKVLDKDKIAVEELITSLKNIIEPTNSNSINLNSVKVNSSEPHKQTDYAPLQVIQYPTKEENTAHIEKLKSSVNVEEYIKQYIKLESNGLGVCPFHNDRTPSLSLKPTYFNCFGCGASGSIIDFIMKYNKSDFGEAVRTLESYTNIRLEPKTIRLIDKIYQEATLKANEAPYLKNRLGYELPLNDSILYSKSVYYKDNEYIANYPAMLAKITNNQDEFIGLHRTYLNDDMSQKRDLGNRPNKKILGRLDGGYVNLIDNTENKTLVIGEGIETVLSLYILLTNQLSSLYDDKLTNISVYANLSATNIPDLPKNDQGDYRFTKIIIAQDNDIAGQRYVSLMKEKYQDIQIEVRIPDGSNDFNDFLLKK